jgi:hypothetical protein
MQLAEGRAGILPALTGFQPVSRRVWTRERDFFSELSPPFAGANWFMLK